MKSTPRWLAPAICLALAAIVWLVFGQTLGYKFINLDDPIYVTANPHVTPGLTSNGIAWAFTHVYASNWHPLTWISHMLDCQIYGVAPRGHHLGNVLLHTATAILLFLVLRNMTGALWPCACVAAFFAIHPLRVESVAWVSERKDVLSGLFFILIIGAYLRYARAPWSFARYAFVLLLFTLGLMSKPMLVTVPLILLLLDYWPLQRFAFDRRRVLFEKLPLLLLALGASATTIFAQRVPIGDITKIPLPIRLGNAVTAGGIYLRQMFWPADLAAYYPFPAGGVSVPAMTASLLVFLAVSGAVLILRRPYLVTGWLWFLIMLAPVIGIIQVGEQAHANRYTYLPQIGLSLALTWGAAELCARWSALRYFFGTLTAVVLVALIATARVQTTYWQNSETLWRHALAVTPDNPSVRRNLGYALYEKGRFDDALAEYQKSLAMDPAQVFVHSNLGITLLAMGRRDEAVSHFETALKLNPEYKGAHSNLGVALLELSRADESLTHLQKALEIDPDFADARYNLGNTFLALRRAPEAIAQYQKAIELDPRDERALNNLAWILATWPDGDLRDGTKAVDFASRADSLAHQQSPVISASLAAAYAEAGRFDDAIGAAQRALDLALREGDRERAASIRGQLQHYQSGIAFRDSGQVSARGND